MKKNKLNKLDRKIHTISNFEPSFSPKRGLHANPSGTDPTNVTITTLTTVNTHSGLKS